MGGRWMAVAVLALGACSSGSTEPFGGSAEPPPTGTTPAAPSPGVSAETHPGRSPPASAAPRVAAERATVTRVVDGDTAHMTLSGGRTEKVRFIGVDAPESTTRHEPYGSEASAYTKRRLGGATVYLQYDLDRRDRYGRLLAYVWMRPPRRGDAADARAGMFNAELLVQGYATLLTVPPNVLYVEVFRALQIEARGAGRGLWAAT